MFLQFLRYRFFILCWILCPPTFGVAAGPAIAAHPLSYTEAWITVSDRIEVKLRLFTDDIIRYDDPSAALPETLPASKFNQILARQTPELLRKFQLYVAGEKLAGSVTSVPDQWTSSDVIDVVGSANVKHTWSFEFQIPDRPVQSLTVRHSFSPPGIEQPGELRLHSRHKPWKQRIDAVVPPDLSYTVVYRKTGSSVAATAAANETTSRIIVSPFAITHEVTLPLTKALAAFPSLKISNNLLGEEALSELSVKQQQQLGRQLQGWIQTNTFIKMKDRSIEQRMSSIKFFESGIVPEQPVPDTQPAPILVPGTLVGIRQTYARLNAPQAGSLIQKSAFLGVSDIRCETIANGTANTSVQAFDNTISEGKTLHIWSSPIDNTQPEVADVNTVAVSENLTSRSTAPGGWQSKLLILLGLGMACLAIAARKWRSIASSGQKAPTGIISLGLVLCLLGVLYWPAKMDEPKPSTINAWMTAAINNIYQSLQAPSEQEVVGNLSRWLSDEMVESTYLTLCQQMAAEPEQATWTGIETVDITKTSAQLPRPDCLTVKCEWEVKGMAYHWGHAHRMIRKYSGQFSLVKAAANWKIQELTQLQASDSITPF